MHTSKSLRKLIDDAIAAGHEVEESAYEVRIPVPGGTVVLHQTLPATYRGGGLPWPLWSTEDVRKVVGL